MLSDGHFCDIAGEKPGGRGRNGTYSVEFLVSKASFFMKYQNTYLESLTIWKKRYESLHGVRRVQVIFVVRLRLVSF